MEESEIVISKILKLKVEYFTSFCLIDSSFTLGLLLNSIDFKIGLIFFLFKLFILIWLCKSIFGLIVDSSQEVSNRFFSNKKTLLLISLIVVVSMPLIIPILLTMSVWEKLKSKDIEEIKLSKPYRYQLLKISEFLFSAKTQKEVFLPVMSDWDDEIFEALKKDKEANFFMIDVRNTYYFILTMSQKSPIGDLIEFVRKIAS